MIDPPAGWNGQGGTMNGGTSAPPRTSGGTLPGPGTPSGGPIVRPPVWGGPALPPPAGGWPAGDTKPPSAATPAPTDIPGVPSVPGVPAAPAQPSIADYMSPYTDSVLQSALKNLDKVGAQRRGQLGSEAFASGAYGDARHGVEDASLTTDLAIAAGDLTSSINADAFDKAMGWNNTDIDRQLGIQLDNANLQGQYLDRGNSIYQNALTNGSSYADALLGLDQYDQSQTQEQLNADYEDWLAQQGYDQNQLSQFLNTINGVPGQSGSSTSTPNNSWAAMLAAALGGLGGGASIFGN